jgi:predicted DNA-binding transcriptional regulator AlpA
MSSTSPPEAPLEVLGVTEIAKRLGVSRQAATELTSGRWNNGFPPPYATVESRRRFWLPDEVEAWSAERQKSTNGGGP